MIICAGCDKPILDKFLMNVMEKSWHASCIACAECKTPLTDKCFSRDGKLYCKLDFFRQYGTKCAGCKNGISPNELVRKAKDQVYHLKCFNCAACKKQLLTGEELFILPDHKFLCRSDYMNSKYKDGNSTDNEDIDDSVFDNENMEGISETGDLSDKDTSFDCDIIGSPSHLEDTMKEAAIDVHNNNNNNNQSEMSNSCGSDKDESNSVAEDSSGNKRRGPRTTIKAKQLEVLKAAFAATPKPTRHIREQLAAETGLNMRVIQVWFQNRRSKERRLKQMNTMGSRRPFFGRAPRRMRGSHMDDSPDMPPPYGFYSPDGQPDSFYSSIYQQYPQEFYPTQGTQQTPVSDVFLSTPEMPPLPHHQGIHESLYIPEVMNQQNAELLVSQIDAGYQRSTVYNSMPHHPQPIESW